MSLDEEPAEPVLLTKLHSSQIQGSVQTRRPLYRDLSMFSLLTHGILTMSIRLTLAASCSRSKHSMRYNKSSAIDLSHSFHQYLPRVE